MKDDGVSVSEYKFELGCATSGFWMGVRPFTPVSGSRSIHHDQSITEAMAGDGVLERIMMSRE